MPRIFYVYVEGSCPGQFIHLGFYFLSSMAKYIQRNRALYLCGRLCVEIRLIY